MMKWLKNIRILPMEISQNEYDTVHLYVTKQKLFDEMLNSYIFDKIMIKKCNIIMHHNR